MDHKVSKDMISSGMIPSGEKTQADLGRTQYGSVPSPSSLMDAYKSMYEHHQKDKDGNTIPHEGEQLNEENLDEINAGYSTDPGKATMANAQVNTTTRQGKPRSKAQMMAARRITSGKSIADVKAANTASMRSNARSRNVDFRAKRRPAPKPMPSNFAGGVSGKGKVTDDFSKDPKYQSTGSSATSGTLSKVSSSASSNTSNRRAMMSRRRRGLMNDVDLFDLIKGRLIDEFYLEEKEALNLMVNLSEVEINEMLGGVKGDGYIGHPRLGLKNPISPPKKETKKTNGGSGLTNKLGNRATEIEKMIKGM